MKKNYSLLENTMTSGLKVTSKRKIAALVCVLFASASANVSAQQVVEEVEIEKIMLAAADTAGASAERVLTIKSASAVHDGANTFHFGDDVFGAKSERQLKNAPYSATAVTEKIQVLRDGNELRRASSKRLYRDIAGRTRDETMNASGEVIAVRIGDSQESGTIYQLKPIAKTATKLSLGGALGSRLSSLDPLLQQKVNEALGKLKSTGGGSESSTTGTGTAGDPKITVMRFEGAGGGNSHIQAKTGEVLIVDSNAAQKGAGDTVAAGANRVKAIVLKGGAGGAMDVSGLGSQASEMLAGAMRDSSFAKTAVKTSLGSRDFSGIRAEGTVSTYTIPANAIGNQQPIVVSDEIWKSPELKLVVYSKRSDPREGDTIYRLENIQRIDQPLSLFTVPADYKLVEPTISMTRTSVAK